MPPSRDYTCIVVVIIRGVWVMVLPKAVHAVGDKGESWLRVGGQKGRLMHGCASCLKADWKL